MEVGSSIFYFLHLYFGSLCFLRIHLKKEVAQKRLKDPKYGLEDMNHSLPIRAFMFKTTNKGVFTALHHQIIERILTKY
ncbi:hypothetical protein DP175_09165 [Polynucleobacter paneuropaeus]|nr:hypothetical protein DP175_09165 [Polynucleobacter paneuropaeus]